MESIRVGTKYLLSSAEYLVILSRIRAEHRVSLGVDLKKIHSRKEGRNSRKDAVPRWICR